jgi:hypothetical protein
MKADDYSIAIQPLSTDEGWQLFYREAFKARSIPTKEIRDIAQQIAEECKGLPLAINVVAAAMTSNTNADEWYLALTQMKNVDPGFLTMYRGIDEDLYARLKWSYDRLNDCNLQNCFLYCGAFSEDANIEVERLVEMWIGEEMVNSRDKSLFMDEGRRYVKLLVERCLFEYVHDFGCLTLRTLILTQNEGLREVPNGFLLNLTSLRVLDLSYTSITSLPDSMWQLKQLEFVGLNDTKISGLPAEICNLLDCNFCIFGTVKS